MIFEKSLLERIDDPQPQDSRSLNVDPGKVSDSITRHLSNMFNVRQGSVMTLDDYGMPDFNDIIRDFPNAIKVIRNVIRDAIRQYEPRLKRVSVTHIADPNHPLELFFQIKAELQLEDETLPIAFETVVGDSGSVKIRN
ncbi:type VI secretion system baseplate subunit TssE [Neptunicella marina]|uniref:Type VI secretion system baseplate subunit TssE n=1 Tax=Neptunicella marina TaxID=2125989 RepID=A0A8J6IVQ4_9ALTE|nr:type VI secretion system baseplate subunit TssE [Neptunicella marina]MBC3766680.1 type VI secretion system baseplate subunit TssE [Neptunicella marina]